MQYVAGTSRVDITPPMTIPYLGGLPRHSLFQGIHDQLFVLALCVRHIPSHETVIILAIDSLGINNSILGPDRNFTQEVRQLIEDATGVPELNIMLASSHAHSTPETGDFRRLLDTDGADIWLAGFRDKLVAAGVNAFESRRPATIKYASGEIIPDGFLFNRRPPGSENPVDPEVILMIVEDEGKTWKSVVVNFACHPVVVQVQPYVSADYPGVATSFVELNLPGSGDCLFLQGAAGNIEPPESIALRPKFDLADWSPIDSNIRDAFSDTQRLGLILGQKIIELIDIASDPDYPLVTGPILTSSEVITVESRQDLPDPAPFQQLYDDLATQIDEAIANDESIEVITRLELDRQPPEIALVAISRGTDPIDAEVQVFRIGSIAIVGLPGEPFVEFGLQLKSLADENRSVIVVGYANDYLGYLTTAEAWDIGGYEVSLGEQTRIGKLGGTQMVDLATEFISELWT